MIARTLYFGNPAYLSTANQQLVIMLPAAKQDGQEIPGTGMVKTTPIEDIGVMILDHPQITITQALMDRLLANNTALITCNGTHHPVGLMLNLDGHTLQSQRFQAQIEASEPLKKQLWQQTIMAKISNQAAVLGAATPPAGGSLQSEFSFSRKPDKLLTALARDVKSGDSDNMEARAAAYYWKHMFPEFPDFTRDRDGEPPNNLLNYGYAILRAVVARNLTGSGLLPTLGIHHRNQYNAYCLADDIMEPYRPYVDRMVCGMIANAAETQGTFPHIEMTPDIKKELLKIPALDVNIDDEKSPLMNAVTRTTASLSKCFEGKTRKILYPAI